MEQAPSPSRLARRRRHDRHRDLAAAAPPRAPAPRRSAARLGRAAPEPAPSPSRAARRQRFDRHRDLAAAAPDERQDNARRLKTERQRTTRARLEEAAAAAAAAPAPSREDRRAAFDQRRTEAAAAPPRAPDPARSEAARRSAATRRRNALSAPVDGRRMERNLDRLEYDYVGIARAMAAAASGNIAEVEVPRPPLRLKPRGANGYAIARPTLTTSYTDAMGPNFDPENDPLPWWFEWAANVNDPVVKEWLLRFLRLCQRWDIRPFQPFWGLSPHRWRNKVVRKLRGDAAAAEFLGFSRSCRAAADLSQRHRLRPCDCELCLEVGDALQAILERAVEYRGLVFAKLGLDDDDDDGLDQAGAIKIPVRRANGDIIELYLNHIEFTPIFAHWLCNDCNANLQSLLDILPASQIAPYLLRLHDMGRTVQGGMTSRRDEPEPESDGYDASLEAMFD